jgi:hypothetical protein
MICFIVMTCIQNATVCIESGHIFVIVIHCTIRHNDHVRNNELLLPPFIYENVDIMFIEIYRILKVILSKSYKYWVKKL